MKASKGADHLLDVSGWGRRGDEESQGFKRRVAPQKAFGTATAFHQLFSSDDHVLKQWS